jgi:hypothetical protein
LLKRLDEGRGLRGNHEVAGEREACACARGDAVHRGDRGHRQAPQRKHQRLVVALDRFAEIGARAAGRHLAIAEVLARAEAAAGARQDQHARAVLGNASERLADFRVHLPVEAVEPLGTVQRKARDAIAHVIEDRRVAHRSGTVIRRS